MPLLGAHMSVAGGLPRAVERAVVHGCRSLQIFAKNASQWLGRQVPADEIAAFRAGVARAELAPVMSHASYLINLATADPLLRQRSIDAIGDELDRAEALGLLGVVLHPGCYTSGDEERGLDLIAGALTMVLERRRGGHAMILLEGTAGQGTSLGVTFEQLGAMIARASGHHRIGVCLDTCHLLAAGYDIRSRRGYEATFRRFERCVGFDRLRALHLNDSRMPLGSRVDRHAHIGDGCLGLEPFRRILNDRRFAHLPMVIETPKSAGKASGPIVPDPLDAKNLAALRGLLVARAG